jgi:hypothetical protein
MSSKAIQWRDWTAWVTNQETSMREITELRRTNSGFAEFYSHYSQLERTSTPVDGVGEILNAPKAPTKKAVPADVAAYAARYRTMSMDAVRKELSPGMNPEGPAAAAQAKRLFDASCAAGLI